MDDEHKSLDYASGHHSVRTSALAVISLFAAIPACSLWVLAVDIMAGGPGPTWIQRHIGPVGLLIPGLAFILAALAWFRVRLSAGRLRGSLAALWGMAIAGFWLALHIMIWSGYYDSHRHGP